MANVDLLETRRSERSDPRKPTLAEVPDDRTPLGGPAASGPMPKFLDEAAQHETLLQLQQLHGNRYVQRVVAEQTAAETEQSTTPGAGGPPAQAGPPPPDAQAEVSQEPTRVEAPTSADVHEQPPAQLLEESGRSALDSLRSVAAQAGPASPPAAAAPAAAGPPMPEPASVGPVDLGLGLAPPADASVSIAQQSAAQLDTARTSAAQLASAPVAFAPAAEEGDGPEAQNAAAASGMLSDFLATVADRAQQITVLASPVADTIQTAAAGATQTVAGQADEQCQAIAARLEELRAQATAEAQAARDTVVQQFTTTSGALTQATCNARQQLESEYTAALQSIEARESTQLQVIDARYAAGDQRFREAGRVVGEEAVQRGKQMADQYMAGLVDEDDSFLDGPLTYNRGKARADTATQMAEGYQKGLQDEANKQADQAQQGKAHDIETARTTARQAREALTSQHTAILQTLADAEASALAQAEQARAGLCDGIDQALQGAVQALTQHEAALQQGAREAAQAQSADIAQQADQLIGALHDQIAQAAAGVLDSGNTLAAQLQGQAAPAPDIFGAALAEATTQLDAGLGQIQGQIADGLTAGEQQIMQAAAAVGDGLDASTQSGLDGASQTATEISTTLQSIGGSASETFSNIQQSHDGVLATSCTAASGGFSQAVDGVQQAYDQMSAGLERGFAENAAALEQGLRGALPKMEDEIRIKAEENASHVPPRWKSVVKWLLIIAVIVVVALVVGPFVIGAVGAALGTGAVMTGIIAGAIVGAATSATIQVINNWAENKPLGEGVMRAAVIGAIGGAVGGGFGAWVGQLGQQGVSIANSAFKQFALNTVANIVTENTINIATGNFSWSSFGMSVLSAVAVGGAMHAASGLTSISGLQESAMASGESVGGSVRTAMGGTVSINYHPTQPGAKVAPDDTAPASNAAQTATLDDIPGGRGPAANDNALPPDNGPGGGASQAVPIKETDLPRGPAANDNAEPEALAATGTDDALPLTQPDQRKFQVIEGGRGPDDAPRAMSNNNRSGDDPTVGGSSTPRTDEPSTSGTSGTSSTPRTDEPSNSGTSSPSGSTKTEEPSTSGPSSSPQQPDEPVPTSAASATAPTEEGDISKLLNGLPEDEQNRLLARVVRGDAKGRAFGTPRNPRMPTVEEFNPRIEEIRAGELGGSVVDTRHGISPDQAGSIGQMSNEELIRFRIEDPISGSGGPGALSVTGGHHRIAEIVSRVASGKLPPDTIIRVLVHD